MPLSLISLLAGSALVAGSSLSFLGSRTVAVRSASAAALASGGLMLIIGLVNALSGTL